MSIALSAPGGTQLHFAPTTTVMAELGADLRSGRAKAFSSPGCSGLTRAASRPVTTSMANSIASWLVDMAPIAVTGLARRDGMRPTEERGT